MAPPKIAPLAYNSRAPYEQQLVNYGHEARNRRPLRSAAKLVRDERNEGTDQRDLISLLHVLAGGRLPHFKTCYTALAGSPSLPHSLNRPLLPCSNALFLIGRVVASAVKICAVNVGFFRNWQTSLDGDLDRARSESVCVHNMIMNFRI